MAVVSSHILNGVDGTHAGGIEVRLSNLATGKQVFASRTDDGGRLSETVDLTEFGPDDLYELVFLTGAYWDERGAPHAQKLDQIVLRFAMPDPNARYHRPIILSPNGYSTWASAPE